MIESFLRTIFILCLKNENGNTKFVETLWAGVADFFPAGACGDRRHELPIRLPNWSAICSLLQMGECLLYMSRSTAGQTNRRTCLGGFRICEFGQEYTYIYTFLDIWSPWCYKTKTFSTFVVYSCAYSAMCRNLRVNGQQTYFLWFSLREQTDFVQSLQTLYTFAIWCMYLFWYLVYISPPNAIKILKFCCTKEKFGCGYADIF